MATRARLQNQELKYKARQADASAKQADAALRQAKVSEDESRSRKVGNILSGVGGLARGAGSLAGGIAALNDPSWYKKQGFIEQASRLPSLPGPGALLPFEFLDKDQDKTVPTIHVSSWMPTIGKALGTGADAANYAASYLMSQLRKYNSRSGSDYDPSDLLMLQVYCAAMIAKIEDIRFCLGAYNQFSATHKLLARALIAGKGFAFSDFTNSRAQIRTLLNEVITRLNYIPIMKDLTFLHRWDFLSRLCIRDARTLHGSYYMFRVAAYPSLDLEETKLEFIPSSQNVITELQNLVTSVTAVTDSASMVVMMSDIRGAINESNLYTVPLCDEDVKCMLSESREMIDQIHNMTTVPVPNVASIDNGTINMHTAAAPVAACNVYLTPSRQGHYAGCFDIIQSPDGYLYQGAVIPKSASQLDYPGIIIGLNYDANGYPTTGEDELITLDNSTELLDFDQDEITTDNILVASRLVSKWNIHAGAVHYSGTTRFYTAYKAVDYGTEIVLVNTIIYVANLGDDTVRYVSYGTHVNVSALSGGLNYDAVRMTLSYSKILHWSPRIRLIDSYFDSSTYKTLCWDIGRLVQYPLNASTQMNYLAVLSEFALEDKNFHKVA